MAVRPPSAAGTWEPSKRSKILIGIGVALIVLIAVGKLVSSALVSYWWYDQAGFSQVFWTSVRSRVLLFGVFGVVGLLIIVGNALLAYRLRPAFRPMTAEQQNLDHYRKLLEPRSKLVTIVLSIVTLIAVGYAAQTQWQSYLLWTNSTPFGSTDPQFGMDISFYTFELPFYRFILSFLFWTVAVAMIAAAVIHYLYGGIRINTPGQRFSDGARTHLTILLGIFVLLKAAAYWFDRYDLLFSNTGKNFSGASAADINAMLPAKTILSIVAIICAIAFFGNIILKNFALPAMSMALLVLASIAIGVAYPAIYDRVVVLPNANVKEAEYIERAMQATRTAYQIGPDNLTYEEYPASSTASAEEIRNDTGTIPNIRLLDPNVISEVIQQTQQVRNIYSFPDKLDVDRYTINGVTQDYVVAVRELDPSNFTETQSNWINSHTVYTHGYGLIAAPANKVGADGQPIYVNSGFDEGEIPVDQPRIYFGELQSDYSIVGTPEGAPDKEFDRPAGESDDEGELKYTYTGDGGVPVDNFFRKAVFAAYYGETNFILNSGVGENSKIIYDRTPRERVEKAAPFLTVDGDPYPAVIDGEIKWIVDAYTTTDMYPYSAQRSLGEVATDATTGTGTVAQADQTVNYIRNSVKATVDAYDGTVTLYEYDENDPVLKTWMKAYPGLIQPKSEISDELASHLRYPEDIFKVQRALVAEYHVTNPQAFYSADGFWKPATDPENSGADQPAYYVRSQLPGEESASFKLTGALTAQQKANLTGYLSAASDPQNYGQLTVLQMPQSSNIYGPAQVQGQFKSDTTIKTDIRLLSDGGSRVIYGNLLTIPIAGGLLYVEPLYVQGTNEASYPRLQKVLLNFGTKIAYANTINEGLNQLFGEGAADTSQDPPPTGGTTDEGGTPPADNGSASAQQQLADANADLQAAITEYNEAAAAADYAAMGAAQQKIVDAANAVNEATAAVQSEAGAAPSSSAPPSSEAPPTD